MNKRQWFWSGFFLSLSLVKYSLIIPFVLVFFVFKKKWASLIVCGSIHLAAHLWLCSRMGISPIAVFVDVWRLDTSYDTIAQFLGYDMWSFFRIIQMAFPLDELFHFLALLTFGVILVLLIFFGFRDRNKSEYIGRLSLAGLSSLLITYHRVYDDVVLIFPLLWMLSSKKFQQFHLPVISGIAYIFFIASLLRKFEVPWIMDAFLGGLFHLIMFGVICALLLKEGVILDFKDRPKIS